MVPFTPIYMQLDGFYFITNELVC